MAKKRKRKKNEGTIKRKKAGKKKWFIEWIDKWMKTNHQRSRQKENNKLNENFANRRNIWRIS